MYLICWPLEQPLKHNNTINGKWSAFRVCTATYWGIIWGIGLGPNIKVSLICPSLTYAPIPSIHPTGKCRCIQTVKPPFATHSLNSLSSSLYLSNLIRSLPSLVLPSALPLSSPVQHRSILHGAHLQSLLMLSAFPSGTEDLWTTKAQTVKFTHPKTLQDLMQL